MVSERTGQLGLGVPIPSPSPSPNPFLLASGGARQLDPSLSRSLARSHRSDVCSRPFGDRYDPLGAQVVRAPFSHEGQNETRALGCD